MDDQQVLDITRQLDEAPHSADLGTHFANAITELTRRADEADDPAQAALLNASAALMAVSQASVGGLGECTLEEPYGKLYPQLGPDGLRWCCTHDPQHCTAG